MNRDELRRILRPLLRRLRLAAHRARVLAVDDSGGLQRLKLRGLGTSEGVERIQPYGLTANPGPGTSTVVHPVLGAADHLVAGAVDDKQSRPRDLAPGEVLLYNRFGSRIYLRSDGSIRIESPGDVDVQAGGNVTVDAGGDVEVSAVGVASVEAQELDVQVTDAGVTALGNGQVLVTGTLTLSGAQVSLTATGQASIAGATVNVTATDQLTLEGDPVVLSGDVEIDGKSFLDHTHGGVQAGFATTGPVS